MANEEIPGKSSAKDDNKMAQKQGLGPGMDKGESPLSAPYTREASQLPPGDNATADGAASVSVAADNVKEDNQDTSLLKRRAWLIGKAQEIFAASTDYKTANITNTWETTLSHFNSEHENKTGSSNETRRKKQGVFRPKTRSTIKAKEASLAEALFSSLDYANVSAENPLDQTQVLSAQVIKNVLEYRLDRKMPWFQTAMGAWQDTSVYGLCITHNYWKYEADTDYEIAKDENGEILHDEEGNVLARKTPLVRKDEMACDNVEPENFHFDPMCDWRDPVGTSPYLILVVPMYVGEALEKMEEKDDKTGQPDWIKYSAGQLLATRRQNYDRTRQAREGERRIDPADDNRGTEYTTVWAHMNIIRMNGDDYIYWTMGTEIILTEPKLLTEAYPHLKRNERPFTLGTATIETHRNYPSGDAEQMAGLQKEINIIANQRVDNVRLALNKRYYVRRGAQVDLPALVRNVPGGSVQMSDPEKDIITVNTPDVTGSSYQEHDRLSVESDELVGAVSQQSIQNQKNTVDSVGGLGLIDNKAGSVRDYGIRIFMETWVEPTLRQFVRMIQYYETDETILGLAVQNSDLWQKFGIDKATDELLMQDLTVRVDAGVGMTNPVTKIERMMYAVEKTAALPGMAERLNSDQIANEVFAAMGYRDASKFYKSAEQYAQETKGQDQTPLEMQLKMRELDIRQEDNANRHERETANLQIKQDTAMANLALTEEISLEEMNAKLGIESAKLQTQRDTAALKETTKIRESSLKSIEGERNAERERSKPTK